MLLMTKQLYFVRHGESELNVASRWAGHTETPLTAKGRRQAAKAGKQAKALGIQHIISSPLGRAHETAKIIAREIGYPAKDIELNSLFIERNFGPLEGEPWEPDLNLDGIADIETVDSMLERAKLGVEHLAQLEADIILVVSHGTFGRAIRTVLHPEVPLELSNPASRFQNGEIVLFI